MNNFVFQNPTKLIFGKGTIAGLSKEIAPKSKVLVLTGGGSIKKNGVFEQVSQALSNHTWVEFSGIEANPQYETCLKALDVVKKEGLDFILAVGGGSVLDAGKFIGAAYFHQENPWSILLESGGNVSESLPVASVLTLPATGSEMNGNSVISRKEIEEKQAFSSLHSFPVFSILDPETTYSLPERQTVNGLLDTYVHVLEQYLCDGPYTPLQNRFSQSILQTLHEIAQPLMQDPNNYELRSNMMWTATMALNKVIGLGVVQDWSSHMIGHELTAFYGVDHGVSLAIVLPRLLNAMRKEKYNALLQYASQVHHLDTRNPEVAIDNVILATENFFRSLGVKTKLSEHGIDAVEAANKISERFKERKMIVGETQKITPAVIKEILLASE